MMMSESVAELPASSALPEYVATRECVPGASVAVLRVYAPVVKAAAFASVTVAPLNVSVIVTVPVGAAVPELGVTVAVIATGLPAIPGLGVAVSAVEVCTWVTTWGEARVAVPEP